MRSEGQKVGQLPNGGKLGSSEQLDGNPSFESRQVEFRTLNESREIRNDQYALVLIGTDKSQDFSVLRVKELNRSAPKGSISIPQCNDPLHPPNERTGITLLYVDIHCFVVILRIRNDREIETLRIGTRKACVSISTPLHRGTNPIPVAEVDIVTHSNLIAVVDHGSPWKG